MNKIEFKEGDKGWFWEPYGLEYLYCEITEISDNRYICEDILGHKYPVDKDKFFKTKKEVEISMNKFNEDVYKNFIQDKIDWLYKQDKSVDRDALIELMKFEKKSLAIYNKAETLAYN